MRGAGRVHDHRAITDAPTRTLLARIAGRVQGVGYRDWTRKRAERLGLSGWVRNRSDGTVEALFHGSAESVGAMLELCRKGPPLAFAAAEEVTFVAGGERGSKQRRGQSA